MFDPIHRSFILSQFMSTAYDSAYEAKKSAGPTNMEKPVKTLERKEPERVISPLPFNRNSGGRITDTVHFSGDAVAVFNTLSSRSRPDWLHRKSCGSFLLTAYAISLRSTGKAPGSPSFGITYSGTQAKVGRTVAVDPRVIPIGTLLYIEGIGLRLAEDTGSGVKGHHIDVLQDSDATAIQFGVKHHIPVYVIYPE